jgi:hypothetical protein
MSKVILAKKIIEHLKLQLGNGEIHSKDLSTLSDANIFYSRPLHGKSKEKDTYIINCISDENIYQSYVLYLYHAPLAKSLRLGHALQQRLNEESSLAPQILTQMTPITNARNGSTVFAVIHEYVQGYHPLIIDEIHAKEIGKGLAKLHKCQTKMGVSNPQDGCPVGYIHTDLDAANIIFKDRKLAAFIDFDKVERGKYITDIAQAIYRLLWEHIDREKFNRPRPGEFPFSLSITDESLLVMNQLIQAYHEERPLIEEEQTALAREIIQYAEKKALDRVEKKYISPEQYEIFCDELRTQATKIKQFCALPRIQQSQGLQKG